MPENIQWIVAEAQHQIPHQEQSRLEREHETAMNRWVRQTRVPVVATDEKVERLACDPTFRLYSRNALPSEGASRLSLIFPADHQRIVGTSPSETVSFRIRTHIF